MKRKLSYLQSTSSRICIKNRVSWVNPATGRWLTGMFSSKGALWKWSSILHAPSRNLEDQLKTLKCAHCTNGCQGMVGARPQTTYNNRRQGSRAKEDSIMVSRYSLVEIKHTQTSSINDSHQWRAGRIDCSLLDFTESILESQWQYTYSTAYCKDGPQSPTSITYYLWPFDKIWQYA